jgi:integrase
MALKNKHQINFILEKRKDKTTGIAMEQNVPILMTVTYAGQRLLFYTGFRVDLEKWIDKTIDEKSKESIKVQRVKKNTVNRDNISAAIINSRLTILESTVNELFIDYSKQVPSISQLRNAIRLKLDEDTSRNKELGFYDYYEKFMNEVDVSPGRKRHFKCTLEKLKRFNTHLTFEKLTTSVISDFENFLKTEPGQTRSSNTIGGILNQFKAFCTYARKHGWLKTNPFENFKIEKGVYGNVIFLTLNERNMLYKAKLTDERLSRTRDMFVLQCMIGARVDDFFKLKKDNIINGNIEYIPIKTIKEHQRVCRVPLTNKAKKIIAKYKDLPGGFLVPRITPQNYNIAIRDLFAKVELNRPVVILNPKTKQNEVVALNTIASSHMARRTFIGNLHKTVKDSVIASMSGHSESSRAFKRYYQIDDIDLKNAIKNIE